LIEKFPIINTIKSFVFRTPKLAIYEGSVSSPEERRNRADLIELFKLATGISGTA